MVKLVVRNSGLCAAWQRWPAFPPTPPRVLPQYLRGPRPINTSRAALTDPQGRHKLVAERIQVGVEYAVLADSLDVRVEVQRCLQQSGPGSHHPDDEHGAVATTYPAGIGLQHGVVEERFSEYSP